MLKRLVKQRKHLSLARRVSKTRSEKQKWDAGNIVQKREVFGRKGRVGISAVYFKDSFSHNIPEVISATFRKAVFTEQ